MATNQNKSNTYTPLDKSLPGIDRRVLNEWDIIEKFQKLAGKEHTSVTRNLFKHINSSQGTITGHALRIDPGHIIVIDIDFHCPDDLSPKHDFDGKDVNDMSEGELDEVMKERDNQRSNYFAEQRETFLSYLREAKIYDYFIIDKTGSGGIHLIYEFGKGITAFTPTKSSYQKAFECDVFDVDIFMPCKKSTAKGGERCVLLPGTYVTSLTKYSEKYIGHYENISFVDESNMSRGITVLLMTIASKVFTKYVADYQPGSLIKNLHNGCKKEDKASKQPKEEKPKKKQTNQPKEEKKQAKPKEEKASQPKQDTYEDLLENKDKKKLKDESLAQPSDESDESETVKESKTNERSNTSKLNYPSRLLIDKIFSILKDKQLEIHSDAGCKLEEEISLPFLIMSLNACVGEGSEITKDDVMEYITELQSDDYNKTENLKRDFLKRVTENIKKRNDTWYGLVKMIEYHAEEERESLNEFLPKPYKSDWHFSKPEEFLTTNYTINEFLESAGSIKSRTLLTSCLVKCIAFVGKDYIVKQRSNDRVKFDICSPTDIRDWLRFEAHIIDKSKKNKTTTIKLSTILNDLTLYKCFKHFDNYDILGNDKGTFSLFRPLDSQILFNCELNVDMIKEWISFIREDRMVDQDSKEAFDHFIMCNAYMLQKKAKASVFFIKYSKEGKTGKSYIDKAFKRMYGEFANTELSYSNMTDGKNGGIADKLYRAWDEIGAPNDHVSKNEVVNFIKSITNDSMTERKMFKDQRVANNYAIDVLNTNDKTAYGVLTNWCSALRSRLCIMRFSEKIMLDEHALTSEEYKERKRIVALIDQPNFACSMYTYLMSIDLTEFTENIRYQRYNWKVDENNKPITDKVIERLIGATPIENFIIWLDRHSKWSKYRGDRTEYKYIAGTGQWAAMYSFLIEYNRNTEGGTPCPYEKQGKRLIEELAKHGIEYKKKNMDRSYKWVFIRPTKLTNMNEEYAEELELIERGNYEVEDEFDE